MNKVTYYKIKKTIYLVQFYHSLFSILILDSSLYKMGSKGIKECPNGYKTIHDKKTCELASIALNLNYAENLNENNSNAICFYCSKWCRPLSTRVSSNPKSWAHFICQKGMYAQKEKSILSSTIT